MANWTTPTTPNTGDPFSIASRWTPQVANNLIHLHDLVTFYVTNSSGVTVNQGDVVVISIVADATILTSTTIGDTRKVGVVLDAAGIANGALGYVAIQGHVTLINVTGTVVRGDSLQVSATSQRAQTGSGGSFGIALTPNPSGNGTIQAFIHNVLAPAPTLSYATPAILLGSAAAQGAAATVIRSDATIAAFDTTAPTTSAVGDAAAVGTAAFAARRDHLHGREAFVTPAILLGTTAGAGAAATHIRSDATIVAFDGTVPVTQAFGDAAATGSAAFAARRDHKHGMPNSGSSTRGASTASGATVTLPAGDIIPITGTTTITSITAGASGARVILEFASAGCQVTNGSNLKLAATYISTLLGTLTLECDGVNWMETGRNPPRQTTAANLLVAGPASGAAAMETARAMVLADLVSIPRVIAYNSGNQSIPDSTWTQVGFDSTRFDIDTQHYTSSAALTGTVTKTASSATLVGSGTTFTSQLSVGQAIDVPGTATERRVVTAITDDTHVTVNSAYVNTASGQTATRVNQVLVIRTAGTYWVWTAGDFAQNSTGVRLVRVNLNNLTGPLTGTVLADNGQNAPAVDARALAAAAYKFNQWDMLDTTVFANSGGALNYVATTGNWGPAFGAYWIGT